MEFGDETQKGGQLRKNNDAILPDFWMSSPNKTHLK